ncbi:MAG: hypothetical protein SPE93_04880 [Candidatus Limivicinus sp.]|nr:hypothetical protein [Candidatus Limivicinus sp.]
MPERAQLPEAPTALTVSDIRYTYAKGADPILTGLSFSVRKREIIALLIGQFTGIILIDSGLLRGLGTVLAAIDVLLMRGTAGNFTYEKLLK